jgi:hypothetical protein
LYGIPACRNSDPGLNRSKCGGPGIKYMLIDLDTATDNIVLNADICIVGAGAAGVALARDMMNAGHDICLIEGGGMDFEERTHSLFDGRNIGMEYYDLDHA